jgi:hypothetical protein
MNDLASHGGLPLGAQEMGLRTEVISLLASGGLPTKAELEVIRAWLQQSAPLTRLEAADFESLVRAAPVVPAGREPTAPAQGPRQTMPRGASLQPRRRLATSVATVAVTALVSVLLTLVIVLLVIRHNPSSGSSDAASQSTKTSEAEATASASFSPEPAATRASSQAPTASQGNATIQWGPGRLQLTGYGSDLTTVPPQSDTVSGGGTEELYSSGDSITPIGIPLAAWSGSSMPTPSQCERQDATQTTGNPVPIVPGTLICAEPAPGYVAIIKVVSINPGESTIDTITTVWIMRT